MEHRSCIVGDELGVLRRLERPQDRSWSESAVLNSDGAMDKSRAVRCMGRQASAGGYVAAGRVDGSTTIHRADTCSQVASLPGKTRDDAVTSVCWMPPAPQQADQAPSVLTSSASGVVSFYKGGHDSAPADGQWDRTAQWQCGASIECCQLHPSGDRFAAGGEKREISIYDAATGAVTAALKAGRPDRVTRLMDLPWTTCLTWLPGGSENRLAAGTAYHKLRLYDTAAQKRPVFELAWRDARVTRVVAQQDGNYVWAANARGVIQVLDVRTQSWLTTLKGQIAGSIRDVVISPDGQSIASVGLDRWLRVHDCAARELKGKVYLKAQATAVCWGDEQPVDSSAVAAAPSRKRGRAKADTSDGDGSER